MCKRWARENLVMPLVPKYIDVISLILMRMHTHTHISVMHMQQRVWYNKTAQEGDHLSLNNALVFHGPEHANKAH